MRARKGHASEDVLTYLVLQLSSQVILQSMSAEVTEQMRRTKTDSFSKFLREHFAPGRALLGFLLFEPIGIIVSLGSIIPIRVLGSVSTGLLRGATEAGEQAGHDRDSKGNHTECGLRTKESTG